MRVYSKLSDEDKDTFSSKSFRDFKGDNALDPFPRVLTQSEYDGLRRGVEQRGTALRMFLQDYYGGGTGWKKVIPEDALHRIISRAGESGFKGKLNPETISFPYGPDIVRTASGKWAVIEDNPGYIGGIGDLKIARDSTMKNLPAYEKAVPMVHEPDEYYRAIVSRAKSRAVGQGCVVMLMTPPYPDFEDARMARIFGDLGVIPVTPTTGRGLVVKPDGVYLRIPSKTDAQPSFEKVGTILFNTEHKFVDSANPSVRQTLKIFEAQAIIEDESPSRTANLRNAMLPDAKTGQIDQRKLRLALNEWETELPEMRKESIRGLTRVILEGKVATNYTPGVDFIGDKEFYTYVDDLVRHYLKEEPVVSNLSTRRMTKIAADGRSVINEELLEELFKKNGYRDHVFKIVDGRGGDGVWIGPKMSEQNALDVLARIRANPDSFIVQRYSHLSVIRPLPNEEGRIVDLRLISEVGPKDMYVTRTPWGRGVPMGGNGKVNLSDRGREFMVAVVPDPPALCARKALLNLLRNPLP
ncbi:MAG: hypothetical protein A2428_16785 [Bdellovibrionales bacterium RIFOXYC1_FULL_54_43]|nr:MAG: hypothetical protein A2428_16785 [Bdellovibrionales bacterium RIFOXYC1_FULL_54_43]OFZ84418.1 MAG: hypothetical protein A2603_03195 [Bdellovibrionales bacterium RIFOXYD1_FULL_55_31]